MSVFPYCLQAHIAEEQGDLETAKIILRKIIYLCPSFVSAYLELGNIYIQEGKLNIAIKMYNSSCEILQKTTAQYSDRAAGKNDSESSIDGCSKKIGKIVQLTKLTGRENLQTNFFGKYLATHWCKLKSEIFALLVCIEASHPPDSPGTLISSGSPLFKGGWGDRAQS